MRIVKGNWIKNERRKWGNKPMPPAFETSAAKVPLAMRYMGALMMTGFLVVGNHELSLVRAVLAASSFLLLWPGKCILTFVYVDCDIDKCLLVLLVSVSVRWDEVMQVK